MNVYLVGYRCTGKSSVGASVAQKLGRTFIDADDYLEEKAGREIRTIFEQDGEEYFRDLESQCLLEIAAEDRLVVGTGGGIVLRPDNVCLMHKSGHVILLEADPETIWKRLQADQRTEGKRPSLTDHSPLDEIHELLSFRRPLYQAAAEISFNTRDVTIPEVAEKIVQYLEEKESIS